MKIKPIKALVFVCLSALIAGPVATRVGAAEAANKSVAKTSAPARQAARVVVVDKTAKTLTVELDGKLYLLKTGSELKLTKDGKAINLGDLAPGQDVSVATRAIAKGGLEITSVNIEPNVESSEAAAKAKRRKGPKAKGPPGHNEFNSTVSGNR